MEISALTPVIHVRPQARKNYSNRKFLHYNHLYIVNDDHLCIPSCSEAVRDLLPSSQELADPMGHELSKIVKRWKHENQRPEPSEISSPARRRYFNQYVPLHKAALKGDWEAAEVLLRDSTLVSTRITGRGETALHIAAVEGHAHFVDKLLERMKKSDLEIQNKNKCTALCFAAAGGHVDIARAMVTTNPYLPKIHGEEVITPLFMAVLQGYKEMADYLFPLSDFQYWTTKDQIELLTTSIHSGLYDLAVKIVNEFKILAVTQDSNDETPLEVLASKPSAFCGTSQGFWGNIASTMLSCKKLKAHNTSAPCDAYTLLNCLWDSVICQEDVETAQVSGHISKLLFVAAESGNDDFLVELIQRYPDLIYKMNQSKHSIFHIAVLRRHEKVFNLMYELRGLKGLITSYIDKNGNNILHLAAMFDPQYQLNGIQGAAFQMQREVLWYKEVEKIIQPSYRSMKNSARKTPYDLFLAEHKDLMKEGKEQMKQTAKSCMLLATLISTVVFTTVFAVPDKCNNTGAPILQNKKLCVVLPISEAVTILASLTSILMFLSILTSRYSDNDFLRWLPLWLVVGVAALLVSIVAMMVAFFTSLLFHEHGRATTTTLLIFFATVPIMFVILKYPLLVTIVRCTYGSKWLFGSNNRLFS